MTREELIKSKEYWIVDIQTKLYEALESYRESKGLNRTQLAEDLGFSKGYISQILNGDFDHRISKLVELALKIGMVPELNFKIQPQVLSGKGRTTMPVKRSVGRHTSIGTKREGIAAKGV